MNELGAVHLSYRGQKYLLKDGVFNVNLGGKPGVSDNWKSPTQYANGVINLNLIDKEFAPTDKFDVDELIVGLIMAHKYLMKKGIELFGEKAEEASLKKLKQIHDMDTYTPMDPTKLTKE